MMKYSHQIKLVITLFFSLTGKIVWSQNTSLPKIVPPSPNASALALFGAIPVEQYNGTTGISIPLYNMKSGDIEVPISISYNSSGIKVAQEASSVGLGWSISAGGMITRSVVGGVDGPFIGGRKDFYANHFLKKLRPIVHADVPTVLHPFLDDSDEEKALILNLYYTGGLNESGDSPAFDNFELFYDKLATEVAFNGKYDKGQEKELVTQGIEGEGQPDIYTVSLPRESFQFFVDPITGNPVVLKINSKYKIETFEVGKWKITDDRGFQFFFVEQELHGINPYVVTSWLMSSIISPNGNYVNFYYSNYGAEFDLPSYYGEAYTQVGIPRNIRHFTTSDTENTTKNLYLTSIESNSEKISFENEERIDLLGTGARRIRSIEVKGKASQQKVWGVEFSYDYFSSSLIGGSFDGARPDDNSAHVKVIPKEIKNSLSKRLKLNGLSVFGSDFKDVNKMTYKFNYIEKYKLPLKTSLSVDHWGYFNGEENIGLLPDISYLDDKIVSQNNMNSSSLDRMMGPRRIISEDLIGFNGAANRGASEEFLMEGMLKEVIYPTGGKTSFTWEANRFLNFRVPSASQHKNIRNAVSSIPHTVAMVQDYPTAEASVRKTEFNVPSFSVAQVVGFLYQPRNPNYYPPTGFSDIEFSEVSLYQKVASGQLALKRKYYFNGSNEFIKEETAAGAKRRVFREDVTLDAGDYILECKFFAEGRPYMPGGPEMEASVSFPEKTKGSVISEMLVNQDFPGGGLRIKEVLNTGIGNEFIGKKRYHYLNEDGTSSGKLMSPINYVQRKWVAVGAGGTKFFDTWILKSSSYIPVSNSAKGNLVGYDRIVEEELNSNEENNGTTVSTYNNEESRFYKNLPPAPNMKNGLILNSKIFGKNKQLVTDVEYQYTAPVSIFYRNFIIESFPFLTKITAPDIPYYGHLFGSIINFYPLESLWSPLTKTIEKTYFNGVPSIKETIYKYSNYNFKPVKILKSTSKIGEYLEKQFSYPSEMVENNGDGQGVYAKMVAKNMISQVIEEKTIKNSSITTLQTSYKDWFNNSAIIVPEQVLTKFGNTDPEVRLRYNGYNTKGNVLSLNKEKGANINYVWSYNNQFPTVEINNLDYTILESILGKDAIITFNESNPVDLAAIETFIRPLRLDSRSKNAEISIHTYKPAIGKTSTTDAKGQTVYYEYDEFMRLKSIKDQSNNIIKRFDYHYKL